MWKCPNCETVNTGDFCQICGEKRVDYKENKNNDNIKTDYAEGESVSVPPKKSGKGILIFICVLLSVIAVILALVLVQIIVKNASVEPSNVVTEDEDDFEDEETEDEDSESDFKVKEKKKNKKKYKVSTYELVREDISWSAANQAARKNGGYLVCINTEEEFDVINQIASNEDGFIAYWSGARISGSEMWEDAYWKDGTKITYTNWYAPTNEPSYYSQEDGAEDCLMIFKVDGDWFYNDAADKVAYSGGMGYFIEYEEIIEEDELENYYYDYAEEITEDFDL